ncbi:PIN domain protein [Neisseria sp. oral taxon 020 str. F0370]|uniref:type II toxin-antitoxin system VapC family toxin n=1 Tax=unclassified Neisseria TaxID=2623750 RepID=UPI0002A3FD31|nr:MULTISPECIES: type II toxin-antitoxin system VapC family toxin [unclassified Neisseria]ASP16970.1 PIN domain-containing protein [Neisseria sp. KEM232]EKY06301.1 PIN domain protein [Neisseria sp. oral taxon 020 str. F0370]
MYLLDTNVLSEIRKISQGKVHPAVAAWAERVDFDRCYLSVITLLEIEQGILRVRHRGDEAQFARLENWLEGTVLPTFDTRILPVDRHTARVCARLHIPDRRPYNDALIAACAIRHDLTLVTRNSRDFQDLQVPLLNPFGEI